MTEVARAVAREAMRGQPLRLRGLAEDLAARGCDVVEIERQVSAIAKAMGVAASPRCPRCYSIDTRADGPGRWRCGRKGCLAAFVDAEATQA